MNKRLQKGEQVFLEITSLAYGGQGVAHHDNMAIFVDDALPGQQILARIGKIKKNYAEAKIVSIQQQSTMAQQPFCEHFASCGGCKFQHLRYEEQIRQKEAQVRETLQHIGGFQELQMEPIVPAAELQFYRNKMEYSFSPHKWITSYDKLQIPDNSGLYLGLHARNFFDKIIDVQACYLLMPGVEKILAAVRDFAIQSGLPAYDARLHEGFWRFLVIRHCKNNQGLMVNLINSAYDKRLAANFCDLMMSRFPEITSLLYGVTSNKSGVAFSEQEYLLSGSKTISEKIGRFEFVISSSSFFQTNTLQAGRLYQLVADYAQIQPHETVYDLYCGAGTISIFLSNQAKKVIGFESVASAIEDANTNTSKNGISNCHFVSGDLRDSLSNTAAVTSQFGLPDVLIIDPPRSGMHPKTIDAILALQANRIIHVSCNPATLARDLKMLCQNDYQLEKVRPVDMFPHTFHIETVALLQRKETTI